MLGLFKTKDKDKEEMLKLIRTNNLKLQQLNITIREMDSKAVPDDINKELRLIEKGIKQCRELMIENITLQIKNAFEARRKELERFQSKEMIRKEAA